MHLSKVSFRYRRHDPFVIEDAFAELSPGDVIVLTGVNGAGKSTLLRLLAGLARPTTGTIIERPEIVGYAPDRFPTGQPFTVTAYLRHMSRVRGGARWEPWAERLAMGHLLALPLGELSKGSAHKVGLVQALMGGPGLLIMDEPFAGLDADTRAALPSIAAEVAAGGGIVVVSDHQGGLRTLPAVRHWTLIDGRLKESAAAEHGRATAPLAEHGRATASVAEQGADAEAVATVAVTLPAGDLPGFLARMREEGYPAREIEEVG